MKKFVCTTCPNGCSLEINEVTQEVTGNKCPRGAIFAKNELTCPKRTVTSSVLTTVKGYPVISVKTNGEIDKELIPQLLLELKKVKITKPLPIGSVVIENVLKSGVNVITTKEMKKGE